MARNVFIFTRFVIQMRANQKVQSRTKTHCKSVLWTIANQKELSSMQVIWRIENKKVHKSININELKDGFDETKDE